MVNPKISIDWGVQVEKRIRRNASNRTNNEYSVYQSVFSKGAHLK